MGYVIELLVLDRKCFKRASEMKPLESLKKKASFVYLLSNPSTQFVLKSLFGALVKAKVFWCYSKLLLRFINELESTQEIIILSGQRVL